MFLLVDVVHDGGEDGGLDLPHLSGAVLLPDDFVQPAEAAAQGGVEVVFDIVVRAR